MAEINESDELKRADLNREYEQLQSQISDKKEEVIRLANETQDRPSHSR